jgi:hypothetical protein
MPTLEVRPQATDFYKVQLQKLMTQEQITGDLPGGSQESHENSRLS